MQRDLIGVILESLGDTVEALGGSISSTFRMLFVRSDGSLSSFSLFSLAFVGCIIACFFVRWLMSRFFRH